ncbi:MAG: hypothetical protein R3B06_13400 [Kofleriaceae bacterium]
MNSRTLAIAAVSLLAAAAVARADAHLAGDGFALHAEVSDKATAGAPLAVGLTLTPSPGYKVNEEFPTSIEIVAPADVTVAKAKLGRGDGSVTHARASFQFVLTPKTAGDREVTLKVKFALCTPTTCEPRKESVQLKLTVR